MRVLQESFISTNFRCYTNHALDQFLEHLLPITKNIVRIGSSSKSEILKPYNLRELVTSRKGILKTRSEKSEEHSIYTTLERCEQAANELCRLVDSGQRAINWPTLSEFLCREFPNHQEQFQNDKPDDDSFRISGKESDVFNCWIKANDIPKKARRSKRGNQPLTQLLRPDINLWTLSKNERRILFDHWAATIREESMDKLAVYSDTQRKAATQLNALRSEYDKRILETADVIGLTTTGLARNASLLQVVNSKTLICEEAGEVLEVIMAPRY